MLKVGDQVKLIKDISPVYNVMFRAEHKGIITAISDKDEVFPYTIKFFGIPDVMVVAKDEIEKV